MRADQGPLSLVLPEQALLHPRLHHVDQEERVAICALMQRVRQLPQGRLQGRLPSPLSRQRLIPMEMVSMPPWRPGY
jgi:hypothetical protein